MKTHREAYVWIWLPEHVEPVVAGRLTLEGEQFTFNYGKTYLERIEAISLYDKELPLKHGIQYPRPSLQMPGCIRDGSPDAWGRRVILNQKSQISKAAFDRIEVNELTFLLESGSDRVGALDFQLSPTVYEPRQTKGASLEELLASSERVEKGIPLSPELDLALFHGSAIGGARPKALIETDEEKFIAKLSSTSDLYNIVKTEFVTMRLAKEIGLNVAAVRLEKAAHKDVLLIERFDRVKVPEGWQRKAMVSALTLFELDELFARYASYEVLAELIRHRFQSASATLKEVFRRLVFNILVGNTDDHARNHAAFWDGHLLSLTPAYDLCTQAHSGNTASQAMLIHENDNRSQIATCLSAAYHFQLSKEKAIQIIAEIMEGVLAKWRPICDLAELSTTDRRLLVERQFFNPFVFENLDESAAPIMEIAEAFRATS